MQLPLSRFFLYLIVCLFLGPRPVDAQGEGILTEDQAREEALLALNYIRSHHPNPYWKNDKSVWEAYEEKLLSRKGSVSVGRQYFDLAFLFSLATDTHTQIYPDTETPGFRRVYPIRFRSFSDGLYVLAADTPYESFIGKKVVQVGDMPVAQLMEKLSHYVSADHSERKKTLAEFLLVMPETYDYLGMMTPNGVAVTLEDPAGKPIRGFLNKTADKSFAQVFYGEPDSFGILVPDGWRTVYDVFGQEPPVTRRHLRKKYWHTTLKGSRGKLIEYVQLNKNEDEPEGEKQYDFILRTFQEIRKKDTLVERVIVDLRYNLGGWIKNTAALPGLLYGADFYKPGKTIVLIGRESVSAGTILAASIEMQNYVCFIGERSGSKPNMFLDHKPVELPYSRFYAESATDVYIATVEADQREYLVPDIPVRESFSDFISGTDSALKKALEITGEEIEKMQDGLFRGELWKRPSQKASFPVE